VSSKSSPVLGSPRLKRLGLSMAGQPLRGKDFVLRSLLGPLTEEAVEALMQRREPLGRLRRNA
jgi:hypothetical protein